MAETAVLDRERERAQRIARSFTTNKLKAERIADAVARALAETRAEAVRERDEYWRVRS